LSTVIIGNGGAAAESVMALRGNGNNDDIHLFSDSAFPAMNPTLLTYYIAGDIGLDDLFPFGGDLYEKYNVKLHQGAGVTSLDARNRTVENADGIKLSYDSCIVCSGASPVVPEVYKGGGVYTIRSARDAIELNKSISTAKKALVVGASLIGIKVVEAIVDRGVEASLCDLEEHVFPLAAHANCAKLIERRLEEKGVSLYLGSDRPDLSRYDIVVVCVGVRPNISFIDVTQVDIDHGILVDVHMKTSCDGLYAAGDCAQLRSGGSESIAYGLWAAARYMGRTAGANIAGKNETCFEVVRHNNTRFFGVDFASVGDISHGDDVFEMESNGKYCRIVWKDGCITGLNLLNMPEVSGILKSLAFKRREISTVTLGKVFDRYPAIKNALAKGDA